MFDDLTAFILLTGGDEKIVAKFEGMNISQLLKRMFLNIYKYELSFVSKLPFTSSLGLNPHVNERGRLNKGFNQIIEREYKKKQEKQDTNLEDESVLDILVKVNKKAEEETGSPKYSIEEIGSTFQIFQFAASDTSYQASSTNLLLMALPDHQKYQDRLREEIRTQLMVDGTNTDYDSETLSSLPYLTQIFSETMRFANPAAEIASRFAIKDFDLCGVKVLKGERIRHFLLGYQPEYFKDPMVYDPERFSDENKKKIPYVKFIPFSHGKRNCIGKYFGELMVKLVLSELLLEHRFEAKEGFEMKWGLCPLYGLLDDEVWVNLVE